MKQLHKNRLLKLANHLLTVKKEKFDLSVFAKGNVKCPSTGCAIGECPVIFKGMKYKREDILSNLLSVVFPDGNKNFLGACKFFNIIGEECDYLFSPGCYSYWYYKKVSPKIVARRIINFVKNNGIPKSSKYYKELMSV